MARNRGFALRPVKSEKTEQTFSSLGTDGSSTQAVTIATATKSPAAATQVEIGDTIKWIFFELNFSAETITSTKIIHWIIHKSPFGVGTFIPSSQDASNKRFILKRGMEMLPKDVGTTIKRIGVVRIPPRMSRMGDGDLLRFSWIATSAETVNVCGNFIFRAYG